MTVREGHSSSSGLGAISVGLQFLRTDNWLLTLPSAFHLSTHRVLCVNAKMREVYIRYFCQYLLT